MANVTMQVIMATSGWDPLASENRQPVSIAYDYLKDGWAYKGPDDEKDWSSIGRGIGLFMSQLVKVQVTEERD